MFNSQSISKVVEGTKEAENNGKKFINGSLAKLCLEIAKEINFGSEWELETFLPGMVNQVSLKGWVSFKQVDTLVHIAERNLISHGDKKAHCRNVVVQAQVDNARVIIQEMCFVLMSMVATMVESLPYMVAGTRVGGGSFRDVYETSHEAYVVKIPSDRDGSRYNKKEYEIFKNEPTAAYACAPCKLQEDNSLVMFKVDYVGRKPNVEKRDGKYFISSKEISSANYEALKSFIASQGGTNKLWDCNTRCLQGGFIPGTNWFVFTDYSVV
jgi:hypothetical protein